MFRQIIFRTKRFFDNRKKIQELESGMDESLKIMSQQKFALDLQAREIEKLRRKLNGTPVVCKTCGEGSHTLRKRVDSEGKSVYYCPAHYVMEVV